MPWAANPQEETQKLESVCTNMKKQTFLQAARGVNDLEWYVLEAGFGVWGL